MPKLDDLEQKPTRKVSKNLVEVYGDLAEAMNQDGKLQQFFLAAIERCDDFRKWCEAVLKVYYNVR